MKKYFELLALKFFNWFVKSCLNNNDIYYKSKKDCDEYLSRLWNSLNYFSDCEEKFRLENNLKECRRRYYVKF